MTLRPSPTAVVALLALALAGPAAAGSWLQDAEADAPGERPASQRLGIRPGSHEVQLHASLLKGDEVLVSDVEIPEYSAPSGLAMRVELDDSSAFGLTYQYQMTERWAVAASWSRASSELVSGRPTIDREQATQLLLLMDPSLTEADLAVDGRALAGLLLDKAQQVEAGIEFVTLDTAAAWDPVLDRIFSNGGPYDADVTFFDVSAIFVVNPDGRWIGEVGGGLGWAGLDADRSPSVFELMDFVGIPQAEPDPAGTPHLIQIANEPDDPSAGSKCPNGLDDPCAALDDRSGLSWNAVGALRYAFTDHVHVRLGLKVRLLESLTDPGDSAVTYDTSLGVALRWGGR